MGNMELRNRNFSTAFCSILSHLFTCVHMFFTFQCILHIFQAHFQNAFFRIFRKTVKTMRKRCVLEMHLEKCEKMRFENALGKNMKNIKNVKKHLKIQLGRWNSDFFWAQFCCIYFSACPTSAGWKWERSSSNRSEVGCANRRSVLSIAKQWPGVRSKHIKSNAEGKENKASIFWHV